MDNKTIYLDHAATTYVDPEVFEKMKPYFTQDFYNPSSLYTPARQCNKAVNEAREVVAECLNANSPKEIIFTGGGSESDNLAIYGICMANRHRGNHIISIPIEHHAVIHTVEAMAKHGFEHTFVPVDKYGVVDMNILRESIRDNTVLITVMFANNEVGTVQPVAEIGDLAREKGVFFHTDGVQAAGSLPIDVQKMNIDALSMSAHKFYGPKGAGALYLREGIITESHIHGGSQEWGRRAGTHNTPGIIGLAYALKLACDNMLENNRHISRLRDRLVKGILDNIPEVLYNGHPEKRLPNNAGFCFKYVDSEAVLLHLDMAGICCSSGSACSTGSEDPSHVLAAMGIPPALARGSLRMSLGKKNTEQEIDYTVEKLTGILEKLRIMSPFA